MAQTMGSDFKKEGYTFFRMFFSQLNFAHIGIKF